MVEIHTLTQAKARLSEIINRLVYKKESVFIMKRKKPVAVIVPYEEWVQRFAKKSEGLAAAAGALAEFDEEIDRMLEVIYAARRTAKDRKVSF